MELTHFEENGRAVMVDVSGKEETEREAEAVGKILEDNGVDVVYTRTEDIYQTPFEKARIANQSGADYFISFHRNSSPVISFPSPDVRSRLKCSRKNVRSTVIVK